VIIISVGACTVVNILEVHNKIFQALIVALTISFPSLIGTFSYMFTSCAYAISFTMAIMAVFYIKQRGTRCYIVGILFMFFSLGIYQAYISVASSLLLLILLQYLLSDEGVKIDEILKMGRSFLSFLIISLVSYYLVAMMFMQLNGANFSSYAESRLNSSESLIIRIKNVILVFIGELLDNRYGLIPTTACKILTFLGIAITAIAIFIWLNKKNGVLRKLLTIIVLLLLPVSIDCMFLFTDSNSVHTLIQYGFVTLYFMMILVVEKTRFSISEILRNILSLVLTIVVINNIYVANESYLCMYMNYENTYSFYTSLVTEIKELPEFEKGCKIALIGNAEEYITDFKEFDDVSNIMGVNGLSVNSYSREEFIRYYIGFDIEFATDDEIVELTGTPQYLEMENYPYYGSVKRIDDFIVVKFEPTDI
jgi:hypothetical protein